MTARHLLVRRRGALAGIAAAALAGPPLALADPRTGLGGLAAGDPAAARIAGAYLRRVADGAERLLALERRLAAEGVADAADARAWLAGARAADFAAGDVLVLEGWVLARAEAELIALAALG